MEETRISNYEITRRAAQKQFLTYDIAPMVKKYGLTQDEEFIYIPFLGRLYRVNKESGLVQWLQEGKPVQGNFEESLTIYDILCYARADAALSGQYASVMHLEGVAKSSNPGGNMHLGYALRLSGKQQALHKACQALGGVPYPVGEVAYKIPMFDFLPIILQFWEADEDFPPELKLMWDINTLHFMHFETTFYAAGCLMQRLLELTDG